MSKSFSHGVTRLCVRRIDLDSSRRVHFDHGPSGAGKSTAAHRRHARSIWRANYFDDVAIHSLIRESERGAHRNIGLSSKLYCSTIKLSQRSRTASFYRDVNRRIGKASSAIRSTAFNCCKKDLFPSQLRGATAVGLRARSFRAQNDPGRRADRQPAFESGQEIWRCSKA